MSKKPKTCSSATITNSRHAPFPLHSLLAIPYLSVWFLEHMVVCNARMVPNLAATCTTARRAYQSLDGAFHDSIRFEILLLALLREEEKCIGSTEAVLASYENVATICSVVRQKKNWIIFRCDELDSTFLRDVLPCMLFAFNDPWNTYCSNAGISFFEEILQVPELPECYKCKASVTHRLNKEFYSLDVKIARVPAKLFVCKSCASSMAALADSMKPVACVYCGNTMAPFVVDDGFVCMSCMRPRSALFFQWCIKARAGVQGTSPHVVLDEFLGNPRDYYEPEGRELVEVAYEEAVGNGESRDNLDIVNKLLKTPAKNLGFIDLPHHCGMGGSYFYNFMWQK